MVGKMIVKEFISKNIVNINKAKKYLMFVIYTGGRWKSKKWQKCVEVYSDYYQDRSVIICTNAYDLVMF
jgi:hypothetical protein